MIDSYLVPSAHPETIQQIRRLFQLGGLNLREQCTIVRAVTGSVAQTWSDADARTLLAMMVAKGTKNLKAWAAEIEEAS